MKGFLQEGQNDNSGVKGEPCVLSLAGASLVPASIALNQNGFSLKKVYVYGAKIFI